MDVDASQVYTQRDGETAHVVLVHNRIETFLQWLVDVDNLARRQGRYLVERHLALEYLRDRDGLVDRLAHRLQLHVLVPARLYEKQVKIERLDNMWS